MGRLMERQAKDGTFYRQVGQDDWEPITRAAKDGTVYKKIGQDDWAPLEIPKSKEVGMGDKAQAALEGFAKSSSLGTLPYLQAAGEVATDFVAEKLLGSPKSEKSFDDRVSGFRERANEIKEKAPGYALAGELGGFLVPGAMISKGVGAGAKALASSSRVADAINKSGKASRLYGAANKAKELGNLERAARLTSAARGDLAAQGLKLGAEGLALGAAYTPESGFSDIAARAENAATGLVTGAAMPFAFRGIGKAVDAAKKVPVAVGKKVLSSLGGVSEDVIERYIKNPERVRQAKSFDELYENVTGIVKKLGNDLDNSKIDYDAAKAHLEEVAKGIKDSRIEGKEKALDQVTNARMILNEAFKSQKDSLSRKASPSNIEPLLSESLGGLKKKVSQGSGKAFDSLGEESVSVSKTYSGLIENLGDLSQRGSESAARAEQRVRHYGDMIFKKGATNSEGQFNLPAKEIKKLIQDIDSDVKTWNKAGGSFDDAYNASLKSLRQSLDEQLKASNPAYRDQMAIVAKDAKLLSEISEKFGKPERALSRLGNLEKPSAQYEKQALLELAKRQGGEFPDALSEFSKAQRTLYSPTRLDALKQSLPESLSLRDAEMKAALAKRMAKPNSVRETIQNSAANFKAQSAKAQLEQKKMIFDKFRSWGEQGAEGKIQQVARGKIYAEKTLSELSKLADNDLVEAVKAAQDAAAFDKTMFNGSRNVNLWSIMGALGQTAMGKGGAGAAAGGIMGGPMGMAIGAMTGGMVDVYGPTVTKKILDGVIRIKGPITENSLKALNIPNNAKAHLINTFKTEFIGGSILKNASESAKSVAEGEPKKGPNKWANDGLERLRLKDMSGILSPDVVDTLKSSKKGQSLLIQASDYKDDAKQLEKILDQIKQEYQQKQKNNRAISSQD